MTSIEDYAEQQRITHGQIEARHTKRASTPPTFWDGAGATPSGGQSLQAEVLSNGPVAVGQPSLMLLKDGSAIVEAKSRRVPKTAVSLATKKNVLILLAKFDNATSKFNYFLCGDRAPQLIYTSDPYESINFNLEIDGVGRDAWVVSGVRYLPAIGTNPIPSVREVEIVTIRSTGIVRSAKIPYFVGSNAGSDFNQAYFLGNASWNITLLAFPSLLDGGLSFSYPLYRLEYGDSFPLPEDEVAVIEDTGSLFTGQVTPMGDPFSRSATYSKHGVKIDFGNPSTPQYSSVPNLLARANIDLGNESNSIVTAQSQAILTPEFPGQSDGGIVQQSVVNHRFGKIKTLSYFAQGSTISKLEGQSQFTEDYLRKDQAYLFASNTNYIEAIAFARDGAYLPAANQYVLEELKHTQSEKVTIPFKFSNSYPPANILGERTANYGFQHINANLAPLTRTYSGIHIASVFGGGQGYFFQAEAANESYLGSFQSNPGFIEPPLSGTRSPIQVILAPGSSPITPVFPSTGQDNFAIGNNSPGGSFRARKRWRVSDGVLYCDKVTTLTVGTPGTQTELDRFAQGESVSVQILSYRMSTVGQFERIKTQKSRLVSIAGTQAINGYVIEALYYGN